MFKKLFFYCIVVLTLCGMAGCLPGSDKPLPGSLIGPPRLSPDGRLIAFAYGATDEVNELLIYDILSDRLRTIAKPQGVRLLEPSFSSDGSRLVVRTHCSGDCLPSTAYFQVAIVNLESGEFQFVTRGKDRVRMHPIFSANNNEVLFTSYPLKWSDDGRKMKRYGPAGLFKVDLSTLEETKIVLGQNADYGFLGITLGTAVQTGNIYLTAVGPQESELQKLIAALGRDHEPEGKYPLTGYVVSPDGAIQQLPENAHGSMASLTSTLDGRKQVFISSPVEDRFSYDLFQTEDGVVSRVTDLQTYMAYSRVSADGSRVVFLEDKKRRLNWSVWIHDMITGQTRLVLPHDRITEFLGIADVNQ